MHIAVCLSVCLSAGGGYLLAMFWANVLQHELNFPPAKYSYSRAGVRVMPPGHDSTASARQLLQLTIDSDVRLLVDMASGQLTVAGSVVYAWFVSTFRSLLENVDREFARRWVFAATPSGHLPLPADHRTTSQHRQQTGK